ncbi:DUF4148 domain-containing protein [Paraburkholderia fungorum]|jgi:hypothetical protein|uniref:DUF4148 domain-containing protein n=1 Tax=Paraburkholderia fungorum TaxID=134537 RepID=A0AAW3V5J4_9BURK|nr:DUF4148 domain-containing protein [Paraburkholderia fungorum]AJZ56055.1 hypothetical protein OI25_7830 [Paraburkholderia fungorum]MBB4516605.1 hypothetical protein [Paraburkholderia fungorum]MBB5545137.1 hypothetical protein [Paraburkholderia fungorum]MBB6204922.1 hypothetical protein [Paraburkholderia fungorum]MBU7442505.1 DUF4148 domain-containing protein [Paraburkholderia fungorum]
MKHLILIKHSVFGTLLLSAAVTAFAGGGGGHNGSGRNQYPHMNPVTGPQSAEPASVSADTPNPDGKTRAQVRAELLQAERAGFAPANKNDYPPSATTIARNQARFQQIEQAWRGSDQMTASGR